METILLSIIAYISTNIDDLFINMIFFAQTQNAAETRNAVTGKFLGTGLLTAVSLLGACGLQTLPVHWLSLLGLVPIALGLREIIALLHGKTDEGNATVNAKTICLSMMVTTIASGADNIGVYMPLFAGFHAWQMVAAVAVFLLMTGLWCLLSKRLTDLPGLRSTLARYKSIVIPVVYILLGLYILF